MERPSPSTTISWWCTSEGVIFKRLVLELKLNHIMAMGVVSFWAWLQSVGHPEFITRLTSLPIETIIGMIIEAETCLAAILIDGSHPLSYGARRDARALAMAGAISAVDLRYLFFFWEVALDGVTSILNRVYQVIFRDIEGEDIGKMAGLSVLGPYENRRVSEFGGTVMKNGLILSSPRSPTQLGCSLNVTSRSTLSSRKYVPRDERTLFITFSNGYPLGESELCRFFQDTFGRVELINMQKSEGQAHPLFARVVFQDQETCFIIMNGKEKVKFMIKGRHVWARHYVPKKKRKDQKNKQFDEMKPFYASL